MALETSRRTRCLTPGYCTCALFKGVRIKSTKWPLCPFSPLEEFGKGHMLNFALIHQLRTDVKVQYYAILPPDDMKTIKTMFTPLLKENAMKHIDYKTFNSIQVRLETAGQPSMLTSVQAIANPVTEARYNFLQCKVADAVSRG